MNNRTAMKIEIVDEQASLQVTEILDCVRIDRSLLIELVDSGVVVPHGTAIHEWQFSGRDVRRLRTAHRLMADLQVDPNDLALILDLIEERDALHRQVQTLHGLLEIETPDYPQN